MLELPYPREAPLERRTFIRSAALALGGSATTALVPNPASARPATLPMDPRHWQSVRDQFPLRRDRIHMASFLLASHPRPVAEAIEAHRQGFDQDPATYWHDRFLTAEPEQRAAAGRYLEADPDEIALTDSTTMGLAMIYGGLRLDADDEILTTPHGHYATLMALQQRAERDGATVRQTTLYDDPSAASADAIVGALQRAVTDRTRAVAVTWVHSSTGVKLPIAEIARMLRDVNAGRDADDRVLLCVDGVHGFGVEDVSVDSLGCDFFVAGTHKWLFGPRGTGLVWGRAEAWDRVVPMVPSFGAPVGVWLDLVPPEVVTPGDYMTPGGFHSFEHRWAVDRAFDFHLEIGKRRVQERIHTLNTRAKEALAQLPHIHMQTPGSPELSAGIVVFDVHGFSADEVVQALHERGILASSSPYRVSHVRLAPSILNDEDEVDRSVEAVAALR